MNEEQLYATMYAVVSLATADLTDLELAVLNNVAQLDGDPRVTLSSEKYLHLFDTKDATGKPIMASETKAALASVVLRRLVKNTAMKRTFEVMPRKTDARFPEFQSSIYEPVGGLHNLICEVYIDAEAEYIKQRLNAYDDLLAACERIIQEAQRDCLFDEEWSEGEKMARDAIAKATRP